MLILGLSFGYHDSAAALVSEKGIVAAAQQERFSRIKNDAGFPSDAIAYCLSQAGVEPSQLDHIAYYERPLLKFDRILRTSLRSLPRGWPYLKETATDWFRDGKFRPLALIADHLKVPPERVSAVGHHLSHAASAYFCSPFERCAILTIDAVGEDDTAGIWHATGNRIERRSLVRFPHSIGMFYSAFTAWLGFEVNEGEYKVMGMAGFGQPRFADQMEALFTFDGQGSFTLDQRLFDFITPDDVAYTQAMIDWLGEPREPEAPFSSDGETAVDDRAQHYADVAASVQAATERILLRLVREAIALTGERDVCMAGGVALNSAANGLIQREIGCRLFIQPAAGDSGTALGAALYHLHAVTGAPRHPPLQQVYLGKAFSLGDIRSAFEAAMLTDYKLFDSHEALAEEVAGLLARGNVVGWMQGNAEWGPRALGNRSILADPRNPNMKAIVNEKIKFREPFRPFAPSVLAEKADAYFDLPGTPHVGAPERFMLSVCPVRRERRADIPAVTHVDGTARVHLVERDTNPSYYTLIKAFENQTGTPLLMNTSFNLRGEPIVNMPADAVNTFLWSGMDALAVGPALVRKTSQ